MNRYPLYGLVLSGGRSSRMGFDKGSIVYHDKPQRHYLFELLSEACDKVYTSCLEEHHVDRKFNPVTDVFTYDSPVSGILTAFSIHPTCAWLAIAIDLPNVDKTIIRKLMEERAPNKMATCFFDRNAHAPEPMAAIWEPAAFPLLMRNAQNGNFSPRNFLNTEDVHVIQDAPPEWFVNINSPHDRKQNLTGD